MSHEPFTVDRSERGKTLAAVLKQRWALSWSQVRRLIEQQRVRVNRQVCTDAVYRLQLGTRVTLVADADPPRRAAAPKSKPAVERGPTNSPALVFIDDQIVVVEKPPGLTTMRHRDEADEFGACGKRFLPPTLADMLPKLIGDRRPVRAVHRLDRDTSGLVVFARTPHAESHLGKQFRAHTVARNYLAVVRGKANAGRIETSLIRDRGDGRRGSSPTPDDGQHAVTHVTPIEDLGEFTLVECRLETGRTHQVRIHLAESGTPLCGERVYDRPLHGAPSIDESGSPRIALHAAYLGLHHPRTEKWLEWNSPLPDDLHDFVARLRK